MENLSSMSNEQLTELINQAEQIRKERLKQEKANIIKDLRNVISKAEELGILFVKENPSYLPTFYNTINIFNSSDEAIYFDFQQNH